MSVIEVTHEFYKKEYGGSDIPESAWKRQAREAEVMVSMQTFGRIYTYDLIPKDLEAVQMAMCAVAEKQYPANRVGNLKSENNDGYVVAFKSAGQIQGEINTLIRSYLAETTLLNRGLNYVYKRRSNNL